MEESLQVLFEMKAAGKLSEESFLQAMLDRGQIGSYKIYEDAKLPVRKTAKSCCYDVFAYLKTGTVVKRYDGYNQLQKITVEDDKLTILPFCRYLIPTGFKFWIPENHSLRIHPRSGESLKEGLSLPNCQGIIDEDYPEQTYGLLVNYTFVPSVIEHNQRICQIESVVTLDFSFFETKIELTPFTDRISGLGHTGSK